MKPKVICIHIGARAHYLLPKALEAKNNLEVLITDTWVSSGLIRSVLAKFPHRLIKSFGSRYTPAIPATHIRSFSIKFLFIELYLRYKYKNDWDRILKRNYYFEREAINIFNRGPAVNPVLGISYTSLDIFTVAKQRGQKTIVFQIDPGYKEEQIVADVVAQYGDIYTTNWKPAPSWYWQNWQKECKLADVIMANSEWSKKGLIDQGIDAGKVKILPLPFQIEEKHRNYEKQYPSVFNKERRLRCLFLGTLTLRKGIHLVLDAASKLVHKPIEFVLVGQNELDESLLKGLNVDYKGVASRSDTDLHYQSSDVFLFPTLSDGFGLTQLESMAWQLPVIASTYCGEVVTNGYNGIILQECNVEELVKALLTCIENPTYLTQLAGNCIKTVEKFSLERFANEISDLI